MSKRKRRIPAFFEGLHNGQMAFISTEKAKEDSEQRGMIVGKILAELEEWQDNYADILKHLGEERPKNVLLAIDRLRKTMCSEWPHAAG